MTPLIRDMARITPEPEQFMWFDAGATNPTDAKSFSVDMVVNLPFPKTAIVTVDPNGRKIALWLCAVEDGGVAASGISSNDVFDSNGEPIGMFGDDVEAFSYSLTENGIRYYMMDGEVPKERVDAVFSVVVACLVKIQSTCEAYQPTGHKFVNRKRVAKGKPPLFDWRTVIITPKTVKQTDQGGHHASPRLHDRRGHWRTYSSGKRVWVKNCKVGDASKGVAFKDYKVMQVKQPVTQASEWCGEYHPASKSTT